MPSRKRTITIRGARQHNLKSVDLDLPRGKLVVFTGPSGSGKSSLAFDTIYAEGQRRYVESLSAYARQFLERMDKPDVDLIAGLAPAIAIEQKTTTRNPRSTVSTQTEVYDHLRLLFARIGTTFSPESGEPVTRDTPRSVANQLVSEMDDGTRFYLCFRLPERKGTTVAAELDVLKRRGFFRILVTKKGGEEVVDLNEIDPASVRAARKRILVVADRLAVRKGDEKALARISDSVEMAFREGSGRAVVHVAGGGPTLDFSEFFERDGRRFEEPSPNLFSFNSPLGACPECQGFGRVTGLDPDLIIPKPQLSIRQGAIAPFRTDQWSSWFRELIRAASEARVSIDAPYQSLSEREQSVVWQGHGEYGGINGFFSMLEKQNYKMHYRILHARYRGYTRCPSCTGYRLREDARFVRIGGLHIGQVCELTVGDAHRFFEELELTPFEHEVSERIVHEITKRLRFLVDVGLDYLTLDRLSQTLSGGESQRIHLATSLGSALVGSLYVLDEPSIGLHPRDSDRLIDILENLRDIGNSVLVVEHEEAMMRRADYLVDMGPGAGRLGGQVVARGEPDVVLADPASLTGAYLSGRKQIPVPSRRRAVDERDCIVIENARQHNLKRIDVTIPLGMVTCVTGVSGSGKSTLIHDILYLGLARLLGLELGDDKVGAHDAIRGHRLVDHVELVDQQPIGRSPRSNPITYIKAFDHIRQLFADTHQAQIRGLKPGYFSFNVPGGRCETCQGEGQVKVEMQFLADLYLECEACKGTRYKQDAREIRFQGKSIDQVLEMTVDEGVDFFSESNQLQRKLKVLQDIGLGYISLGQPSNTLSGGEAQRIKLAAHLAKKSKQRILYLFDEPTTGLHFDDIRKLLGAFDRLVKAGHAVVIIEHNLDVIKCADHLIDMGPEGGVRGGFVVATGTPEQVAGVDESHTGRFLRDLLPDGHPVT
ncbi:MAG: excinuclease ABC subunit UvrA [Rhodothermales bacterium]|nr:excinuclease ABC subunit UvrA [Rhodothermales bacterium]MBO6778862.1 excinuclease ABC subunit UvrA [Rhodothermales bacterium]